MNEISFGSLDVNFHWNNEQLLFDWLLSIASQEQQQLNSLSYVFCSDQHLLEMNKTHLDHDYFTDIITFDLSDDDSIEGEIYISIDRVKENAATYQTSFEEELCRVMCHGLLHLIGYDDHNEADIQEMRAKETFCLSLLREVPRGTFQ